MKPAAARIDKTPMLRRSFIYSILAGIWILVCGWQYLEYRRLLQHAREGYLNRARDMATVLEVVIRSTRRFHTVSKQRLQDALDELAKTSNLLSVALVSPGGDAVTEAGSPLPEGAVFLPAGTQQWAKDRLTVVEVVRLGDAGSADTEGSEVLVIETRRGPPSQREPEHDESPSTGTPQSTYQAPIWGQPQPGPPPTYVAPTGEKSAAPDPKEGTTPLGVMQPPTMPGGGSVPRPTREEVRAFMERLRNPGPQGFPRHPPWMSPEEYRERLEKQGLRNFVLVLSTTDMASAIATDRWQRLALILAVTVALGAVGIGWHVREEAARLSINLVRTNEMNTYLKEMNMSAAGLAHETRNPLNVVRGLAQLVHQHPDVPEQVRDEADTIIEEVDRVNSRLDQFIAYSKPYEPVARPVILEPLVHDVFRTLEYDREDRHIVFSCHTGDAAIVADEGMLRQVLFNLILNACQAVQEGGSVSVGVDRTSGRVDLWVRDDGPGVPDDKRHDVFRPYVSLRETGSGLGLAVVRQIALAHGWDVTCGQAPGGTTEFRIMGISLARTPGSPAEPGEVA